MKTLIIIITLLGCLSTYAQNENTTLHSHVSFFIKHEPKDSADLDLKIIYKNESDKTDSVYYYFIDGNTSDEDYNLNIQMEKWDGKKYVELSLFFYTSTLSIDGKPFYLCSDLPKKALLPGKTDTVVYNLMRSANYFLKGKYRFRAFVRKGCSYKNGRGTYDHPLLPDIDYVNSKWIYFELKKPVYKIIKPTH